MHINIPLSQLQADPRNANVCSAETLAKLARLIAQSGRCPSLIVRPHPSQAEAYILIDGHHRKQVLEKLGWPSVDCELWDVNEQDAALLLATLNRLRGTDDFHKRAELLQELTQTFAVNDLAQLIPESASEIDDMLRLLQLDMEALEESYRQQIEAEKEVLPIPITFMVSAEEASLVETLLKRFQAVDRSAAFICLCHAYISLTETKDPHKEAPSAEKAE